MNPIMYKGYAARVEYSDEDACFVGHIAGISDIVGFHADTVASLKTAFSEAVDDYLATAEQLKRAPKKPYSGKLMLRLPPEVHARAAMLAEATGKSINAWATEVLATVAAKRKQGERAPQIRPTKQLVSVRYSPEVLAYFKSDGSGWKTRMDEARKAQVPIKQVRPVSPTKGR